MPSKNPIERIIEMGQHPLICCTHKVNLAEHTALDNSQLGACRLRLWAGLCSWRDARRDLEAWSGVENLCAIFLITKMNWFHANNILFIFGCWQENGV